jgi:hypothetical protein
VAATTASTEPEAADSSGDDLPPRALELLGHLRNKPEMPAAHYAKIMYNSVERAPNVAAYFSRMKASGHVENVARGRFKITAKGVAAITK